MRSSIRQPFNADDCYRIDLQKLLPEHLLYGTNKGLFSNANELFQLFSTGKPSSDALTFIEKMQARVRPPDSLMVIILEWDYKYKKAAWFKKLSEQMPTVICEQLPPAEAKAWIKRWAVQQQVALPEPLVHFLSEQTEGNLFAAKQAITKLALIVNNKQTPDLPLLRTVLADGARYDILDLSDAIYNCNPARALAILQCLRTDGIADTLIQWSINNVLNNIAAIKNNERVFAWGAQLQAVQQLARHISDNALYQLIRQAAYADRVIKGVAIGDSESILGNLTARLATANSGVKITLPKYQPQ